MVKNREGQRGKILVADPFVWNKGEGDIHYNNYVFLDSIFLMI